MELETRTVHDEHPRTTRNETVTRWSSTARITLGVITFLLIAIVAATGLVALLTPTAVASPPRVLGPLHYGLFIGFFTQFLLIAIYVSFAAQNPRTDVRFAWIASMILMPWAALPIYWWVHIWKAPSVSDPSHDYNVPGGALTPHAD